MTKIADAITEQLAQDTARAKSVVGASYKRKYAERAITARGKKGVDKRVVAQSNGDWLALEVAALTRPNPKKPTDIAALEALLDANGVEHAHLPRNTAGWQGRFAMSGRLALRTVVADAGYLVLPDGSELVAPRSFCNAWAK